MSTRAVLRVCMSCEWIFRLPAPTGCPKCSWGHYSAHYVYGAKAYRFAATQQPWFDRCMASHAAALRHEICAS